MYNEILVVSFDESLCLLVPVCWLAVGVIGTTIYNDNNNESKDKKGKKQTINVR